MDEKLLLLLGDFGLMISAQSCGGYSSGVAVCEQGLNLLDGAGWLSGCIPASLLTGDETIPTPKGFLSPCTHNEVVCLLSAVDYVTEICFIKYKAAARLLVLHFSICIYSFIQAKL